MKARGKKVKLGTGLKEQNQTEKSLIASENLASILLNNSPNPTFVVDKDNKIIYVNPILKEITGYSSVELIGKTAPFPWWGKEDAQKGAKILDLIARQGAMKLDKVVYSKNGKQFYVEVTTIPIRVNKNLQLIVIYYVDVTERKHLENALWKHINRNELILQTAIDGFCMTDMEGKIIKVNAAAGKIFGYLTEEIIGKNFLDLVIQEERNNFIKHIKNTIELGAQSFETKAQCKDGKNIDLEVKCNFLQLDRESLLFAFLRDVTERNRKDMTLKERETDLKAKTINLEELNTALRVLLKRVELDKTELENMVISNIKELVDPYLNKLEKTDLDATQMGYLNILRSNLNEIVSPFLVRLSSKYLRFTPSEIQVANLVKCGKTTKEIAELLNLSCQTIDCHRKNIRKKIGITNKKLSLRTYLLTIK